MSTLAEIEEAIETLPASDVETLAEWLEQRRHAVRQGGLAKRQIATGFVQKWGGSTRKIVDENDSWLTHINEKHLR